MKNFVTFFIPGSRAFIRQISIGLATMTWISCFDAHAVPGKAEVEKTRANKTAETNAPPAICEEFRKSLSTRVGLVPNALEAIVDDRGKHRIPNIDIDGDDSSDELLWSCPMAGSSVPADPCTMSIKLSSSGKTIKFERLRFFLIRYHSKIYAVGNADAANKDVNNSNIYSVDASGLKLICSNLQGKK